MSPTTEESVSSIPTYKNLTVDPSHDTPDYTTPPTTLEDDPVYRRHAADWQTYHTRYVAPDRFHHALRLRP